MMAIILLLLLGNALSSEVTLPTSDELFTKVGDQIKFTKEDINRAIKGAKVQDHERKERVKLLKTNGLISDSMPVIEKMGQLDDDAVSIAEKARFAQDVINSLSTMLSDKLMNFGVKELPNIDKPKMPNCDGEENKRYRNMNGQCNNLKYGLWGTPFTAQKRFLPATYGSDGISPRETLKSERAKHVSERLLHSWRTIKDGRVNAMATQIGQFINHDISFTPIATFHDPVTKKPQTVKCCAENAEKYFEDCFPLRIDKEDWYYRKFKIDCIDFIRSAPAFNERNGVFTYGSRQQMNQVTSFIDGSQIYGSDEKKKEHLADLETGLMKTSEIHNRNTYLPKLKSGDCQSEESNQCFQAGDDRVNTQLNLMVMHTVFMREHNRIASYFKKHTNWNGEKVFEETRRLIGAFLQVITFKEYLPAILNPDVLKEYGLNITNERTEYKDDANPSIFNEFSTAAFRFGHSQVYHKLAMSNPNGDIVAKARLSESYLNPDQIYDRVTTIQEYITGLFYERSLAADRELTSSLTRDLFVKKGDKKGQDLGAINVQRGRDHGIPTYANYRALLKGNADFTDVMTPESLKRLKTVYETMDNVDLYIGGLYEKPMEDSAIGETFNHMIASQFRDLMLGDRYFYSHKNTEEAGFSDEQCEELKKVSLAYIMCHSADLPESTRVQIHGCLQTCPTYMKKCKDIEKVNLKVFIED